MLAFLRNGAQGGALKFVLLGFMLLAGGGLVLMDVGGFFRNNMSGTTEVITVGHDQISLNRINDLVNRTTRQQGMDVATAYRLGLIQKIVQSEIANSLTRQAGHAYGVTVSDKEVAKQIGELLAPAVKNGMSKEDAFKRMLMMQGMTERAFVQAMKAEITNTMLRNAVMGAANYTPEREAEDLYRFQYERRNIEAIDFPNSAIKDYDKPTDEVLMPFYQAGQERYALPETRKISMVVLDSSAVKDTIDVSDEALKKLYEDDKASFEIPEQRNMEQAVFKTRDEAAKVKDEMTKDDKSMKAAVKDVTGKETAYLGDNTFERKGLFPEIADTAFGAAKVGDVIGPFETKLGWHVLKIEKIIPPSVKPFDKVKDQLEKDMIADQTSQAMYDLANNIDNQIGNGSTLEDIAKSFNLKVQTLGPLRKDGTTIDDKDGLKAFPHDHDTIMDTTFELLQSETAPVMELSDGRFALLRVDNVTEKSYKPFEDVKGALAKLWIKDQQAVLNKQRVEKVMQALESGDKTLAQIAKQYGLNVKTYKDIVRIDNPPKDMTKTAKTKFFGLQKGEYTVATAPDGFIVGEVSKITLPDISKVSKDDLQKVRDLSSRGSVDEVMMQFLNEQQSKFGVKVDTHALERAFGPGHEDSSF